MTNNLSAIAEQGEITNPRLEYIYTYFSFRGPRLISTFFSLNGKLSRDHGEQLKGPGDITGASAR